MKDIWNKLQGLLDKYQVVIGVVLLLVIAGAGIAWLFQENRGMSDKTANSQLSGEIKTLREQNEQLLVQLKQIEEKHNQLVQDLAKSEIVKQETMSQPREDQLASKQKVAGVEDEQKGQPDLIYTKQRADKQPININTASTAQLDSLPGIGPVYAQRIIDYRQMNGGFKSIDELTNVKGIGPKTLEKIKNKVTI